MRNSILIFFAVVICLSCTKKQDKDAPANFEIKPNEQTSLDFLVELVEDNPENPENYIRLSDHYLNNGEYKTATTILENAYKLLPRNVEINEMLIDAYLKQNESDKADEVIDKLDMENNKIDPYILALINYQDKDFEDALEQVNLAIKRDRGNADYYVLKARALSQMGDSARAVPEYDRAIKLENASLRMVIDYLRLLKGMDRMEEFGKVYQQLASHQKSEPEVKLVFAGALINIDQLDSAKAILSEINEPQYLPTRYHQMAEINFNQRNYDSAIFYAEKGFELNRSPETMIIKARSLDSRWRYSESVETYEQILEIDSTYTIAEEELAKLRRKIRYLRDLKRKEEMKIETLPSRSLTPKNLEQ